MQTYKTVIGFIVAVIAATDYAGADLDGPRPTYVSLSQLGGCKKTCDSTTDRIHDVQGVFQGKMDIPITNQVTGGWIASIEFKNKVKISQIWNANVQCSKTTEKGYSIFVIANESWNGNLDAGTSLSNVGFKAEILDGQLSQPFYVNMHSQPECQCD